MDGHHPLDASKIMTKEINITPFDGLVSFAFPLFEDDRGAFMETYRKDTLDQIIGNIDFVQENQSISKKLVFRGFHFQKGEHAQAKLVRVTRGAALDIVIDLRPDSVTYGSHYTVLLTEQNRQQLFIPRGFAHGFFSMYDNTILQYKCDNYYNKEAEAGIRLDGGTLERVINVNLRNHVLGAADAHLIYPRFETYQINERDKNFPLLEDYIWQTKST